MNKLTMALCVALVLLACNASAAERTIALTFDDAPRADGALFSGAARTARLEAYTDAGHVLGNHSFSHQWLSRTDTDEYIADLDRAVDFLAGFEHVEPLYRFPFLDEGRSSDKRDALRKALVERGLRNGYVTVDTYDWYLEALVQEAAAAGIAFDRERLRDLYVDVIVQSTEFYDAVAQQVLDRSPHHVLLLHENDLAALFVGDLVAELEKRGFRIITATEAFEDPIAGLEPDTLFLNQGRVAALAHEAGWDHPGLASPTEDEDYLRARFERDVAALPAAQ